MEAVGEGGEFTRPGEGGELTADHNGGSRLGS